MKIRDLNPNLSIGAQPTPSDIEALRDKGFRSIVSLRTPDEPGVVADEERLAQAAGLNYASIPIAPDTLDDGAMERLTQALDSVDAAPAYLHCKSGGRAGVFALLHLAIQDGWSVAHALEEGEKMGIEVKEGSPYRAFFEDFLRRRSPAER